MAALLRKARAVFLLRARWLASESRRQVRAEYESSYRRKAARELDAARLVQRLITAPAGDRGNGCDMWRR